MLRGGFLNLGPPSIPQSLTSSLPFILFLFSQDEKFTVEVYELSDLKKEYDLTVAQLSLLQLMERQALNPNVPSSAQETVAQLVNMKGYELAISVARR